MTFQLSLFIFIYLFIFKLFSAGCGRTGAFCAIDSVLTQLFPLKTPSNQSIPSTQSHSTPFSQFPPPSLTCDTPSASITSSTDDLIFEAVQALRSQRKLMVQSLSQFVFCYEVVLEACQRRGES